MIVTVSIKMLFETRSWTARLPNKRKNGFLRNSQVLEQKKGLAVRSGIWTHAYKSRLRPERSALDRSAILTTLFLVTDIYIDKPVHGLGK